MAKSRTELFIVGADEALSAVTGLGAPFQFATSHFIMINVGLVAYWVMTSAFLARLNAERSETSEKADAQGFAIT